MTEPSPSPAEEFSAALLSNAARFGVELSAGHAARLRAYYEQTVKWNTRLHLVAPCTPAEFAVRHVLESLLAVPFLSRGARLIDVGSGAGLPAVPCLVARPDLRATLFE
ncbi:MAG: RsmG family class I SAM-dependent methyltransferase, partial [Pyrinomonadaceae bacterium]